MAKLSFKKLSFKGIFILYVLLAAPLAWITIEYSGVAQTNKHEYARISSFEERFLKVRSLIRMVLSRESSAGSRAEEYLSNANNASDIAVYSSIFLGLISVGFLAYIVSVFRTDADFYKRLWYGIFGVALVSLVVGISTPILEITAFEDDFKIEALKFVELPIKGEIVFYHQNKSILDVIGVLFDKGNYLVGVCIFLFSLIIPFGKLFMGWLFIAGYLHNPKLKEWLHQLGKWSMADVFVVSIFLSFMSFTNFNTGISTKSQTFVGFYFFLAYCVLSIYAGFLANKISPQKEASANADASSQD